MFQPRPAQAPAPAAAPAAAWAPPEPRSVPHEEWRKVPKWKVRYTKDCTDCGLCLPACPYGVHRRAPGSLRLGIPDDFGCLGPDCERAHPVGADPAFGPGYCVAQCPTGAITLSKNPEWAALGDPRWSADLLFATWTAAETGRYPRVGFERRVGESGGGFDRLRFKLRRSRHERVREAELAELDTSLALNRRREGARISIPVPWYGGGMSYGSVGLNVMVSRARAARAWGTFTSTGEGGYPRELLDYKDHVITQVATGMFGVSEETLLAARIVELKYAQGAKPGLGGHLLADKNTSAVAAMRETSPGISLFSPFPFHSVYSVEDHRKHVDWIRAVNPGALVSAKVSTPADVDMVAVGCYYGGVNLIHLDGAYGGTGAAPDIAKKNIAMPLEFAIPKVHRFLEAEGIRDEVVVMASGGIRSAHDIAKAIALGADGAVLGTAELVAVNCTRCGNCEAGRGCQHGIASTDPALTALWSPDWGAQRISNLYYALRLELAELLWRLDLKSARALRGRYDVLYHLDQVKSA
ncbi:MAG: alpha-hydroxy-acid oxidizing protein [Elusimicrobia bacterium]|nr:alpha-hydroxy-acid oxidizing protein [Elusimicrobiota bacterium]